MVVAPYENALGRVFTASFVGPRTRYYSLNSRRFSPTMQHAQVYLEDRFGKHFHERSCISALT